MLGEERLMPRASSLPRHRDGNRNCYSGGSHISNSKGPKPHLAPEKGIVLHPNTADEKRERQYECDIFDLRLSIEPTERGTQSHCGHHEH